MKKPQKECAKERTKMNKTNKSTRRRRRERMSVHLLCLLCLSFQKERKREYLKKPSLSLPMVVLALYLVFSRFIFRLSMEATFAPAIFFFFSLALSSIA